MNRAPAPAGSPVAANLQAVVPIARLTGEYEVVVVPAASELKSMADLVAQYGRLPETYVVQTGSGGWHYYFAMPDFEVRNSQSKIAKGIDVRGTGGQVVAAPSRTDKGSYAVKFDRPVVSAPEWLLDLVRPEERSVPVVTAADLPKPDDIEPGEWERLNRYSQSAIKGNLERLDALKVTGWNGEPWDATTFEVACALIEIANSPWNSYSLGQAKADLLLHAPRDTDGFDDWKVNQKFDSALERVGDKARPMPANRQAEPDPLFGGPDVRVNPTSGAGEPTTPGAGSGGGPERFFGEGGSLDVAALAQGIMDQGPVGWGVDEAFWSYSDGVWQSDRNLIQRRCVRLLGGKYRDAHAKNTIWPVKEHPACFEITGEPLSQYMNFRNGMLDWQTGELLGHDANFKSITQFPINYTPEATCPTFDAFLADVMHQDYVDLAWEMIGYLMYSGNPLQVAFMLYGSGGNGKGTLVRVIQDILGLDNVSSEPLDRISGDRFSTVNLFGKIANIAGDIDATYQESTAAFKRLTGEDEIIAERKYGDRFNFRNWAVPLFSANKIPGSSDVTEGYLRRWIVLHFHKRITNPTPGLSDLLALEVEGIAAKAVIALRRLMERNKFDPRGEAVKAKQEFAMAIDQVRQWAASQEVQDAPDHFATLESLYAGYSLWAGRTSRGRLNEQEFSHRLEGIGYPPEVIGGLPHHKGLRVVERSRHTTPVTPGDFF